MVACSTTGSTRTSHELSANHTFSWSGATCISDRKIFIKYFITRRDMDKFLVRKKTCTCQKHVHICFKHRGMRKRDGTYVHTPQSTHTLKLHVQYIRIDCQNLTTSTSQSILETAQNSSNKSTKWLYCKEKAQKQYRFNLENSFVIQSPNRNATKSRPLEFILRLKIKHNDWLLVVECHS